MKMKFWILKKKSFNDGSSFLMRVVCKGLWGLVLVAIPFVVFTGEPGREERVSILDAIRPVASKMAGQPIRFKVDRLNVDGNWAV